MVAKQKKQALKGFIGPIGFDLPSIMPIVFATMIFFSAISYSYTTINEKNNSFDSIEASIKIADILKGDSYLEFDTTNSSKKNEYSLNCEKAINIAKSKNINFAATFVNLDSSSELENILKNKKSEIDSCKNDKNTHLCWCSFSPKPFESNLSQKYWSISFPVTVDIKLKTNSILIDDNPSTTIYPESHLTKIIVVVWK